MTFVIMHKRAGVSLFDTPTATAIRFLFHRVTNIIKIININGKNFSNKFENKY